MSNSAKEGYVAKPHRSALVILTVMIVLATLLGLAPGSMPQDGFQPNKAQAAGVWEPIPEGDFVPPVPGVVNDREVEFNRQDVPETREFMYVREAGPQDPPVRYGKNVPTPGANRDGWFNRTATVQQALFDSWAFATADADGNIPGKTVQVWWQLECWEQTKPYAESKGLTVKDWSQPGDKFVPNYFVLVPPSAEQQAKGLDLSKLLDFSCKTPKPTFTPVTTATPTPTATATSTPSPTATPTQVPLPCPQGTMKIAQFKHELMGVVKKEHFPNALGTRTIRFVGQKQGRVLLSIYGLGGSDSYLIEDSSFDFTLRVRDSFPLPTSVEFLNNTGPSSIEGVICLVPEPKTVFIPSAFIQPLAPPPPTDCRITFRDVENNFPDNRRVGYENPKVEFAWTPPTIAWLNVTDITVRGDYPSVVLSIREEEMKKGFGTFTRVINGLKMNVTDWLSDPKGGWVQAIIRTDDIPKDAGAFGDGRNGHDFFVTLQQEGRQGFFCTTSFHIDP